MSRHRNIRRMNYDEEDDGYYDASGRSVEDDFCISPSVAEFMYDRNAQQNNMVAYFKQESKEEIPWERDEDLEFPSNDLRRSSAEIPRLGEVDEARLKSCLEGIRDVVGETLQEKDLIDAVLKFNFDQDKALDSILTAQEQKSTETPKPQWERKEREVGGRLNQISSRFDNKQEMIKNEDVKIPRNVAATLSITSSNSTVKTHFFPDVSDASITPKPVKEESVEQNVDLLSTNENVSSDMQTMIPAKTNRGRENASSKVDALAEYKKFREGAKDLLNLVVIGHVDAGKSTLMGHLLCLVGAISKKVLHKYEQESKKIGKASFMYAWVLDETGEERSRGITMDVGYSKFETDSKIVTLLDAPGHKDFIPNMITGAAQADVAVLVVDSTRGEFETGFETGGQTREHALLVRSLGVSQLVVAINKLDNVNWSEERYKEIVAVLSRFLKQAGFKENDVTYIPCSGLTGENLVKPPSEQLLKSWYSGATLLDQIDKFIIPERPLSKPLRLCVSDVFKAQGSTFSVAGKIETGFVQGGDKVLLMPLGETATVRGISMDDISQTNAFAGDQITLSLTGIDMTNVTVGCVICDFAFPIRTTNRFRARIVVFNIDTPITRGFPAVLHCQSLCEPVVIKKLVSVLHKGTGEVTKSNPRCLTKQSNAIVEIEVNRAICLEEYKDIKELGRFMLRSKGATLAAGVVTQIM